MKTLHGLAWAGLFLLSFGVPAASAQDPAEAAAKVETMKASGTFKVKLTPEPVAEGLGRMNIDKTFEGELEGTSYGEMLSAMGSVKGSAGYVAMEVVKGKLHGKSGTFVLQHLGVMDRGEPSLSVTVVPDSGTGELVGLKGKLAIRIADGKHYYDFEFTLEQAPSPPG